MSTLRYADSAKKLATNAIVNEDPRSKKIRELMDEITRLRALLDNGIGSTSPPPRSPTLEDADPTSPRGGAQYDTLSVAEKIALAEGIMRSTSMSWEERERVSQDVQAQRATAFQRWKPQRDGPALVNLSEDPMLTGCLIYSLPEGNIDIGSDVSNPDRDIFIEGDGIEEFHASVAVKKAEEKDCLITVLIPGPISATYVNGLRISGPTTLRHNDRIIFGDNHIFRFVDPRAPRECEGTSEGSPSASPKSAVLDFQRALEERFNVERAQLQKAMEEQQRQIAEQIAALHEREQKIHEQEKQITHYQKISDSLLFGAAAEPVSVEEPTKLTQVQRQLEIEDGASSKSRERGLSRLRDTFLSQTTVQKVTVQRRAPNGQRQDPTASTMQSSLIHAAQIAGAKLVRLPNEQVFRFKAVLLGHQEVGKTSLRKCFENDPLFFKKLPDVKSTTGIELQEKAISVGQESIKLTISDFAGQESYHSHTLFLTNRSIFVLVWKISAVAQDFQSSGISEHEEKRLHRWIAEVYAKYPKARLCLVATHLDELRDQSQKGVEAVLTKVERLLLKFMETIAVKEPETGNSIVNPIVGNFAVTCKNRTFIASGRHRAMSGGKLSVVLRVIAESAFEACMADDTYYCGAIPGRHIRLLNMVLEIKSQQPPRLLLPLAEYVHLAVQCGVESDAELLEISQLLHSWSIIYLFNPHRLTENIYIFLHPEWLCRICGVLFSFAHVLQTPLHLRSIIGGLEYSITAAIQADMAMMRKGFLRIPLAKVLFRKSLVDFFKREPEDSDVEMCVQFLAALGLLEPVSIPCDDLNVLIEELPDSPNSGRKHVETEHLCRYFVPSLSPFFLPAELRRLFPIICHKGAKIRFEFNMLPNEMWWRLQSRLQNQQRVISVCCPSPGDDLDDDYRLPEADHDHNRWKDAMWLGNNTARLLMMREGSRSVHFCSAEQPDTNGTDDILKLVEEAISDLLAEYKGLRRTIMVMCPIPHCGGWHDVSKVVGESVHCNACGESFPADAAVAAGVGPLGPPQLSPHQHHDACELLHSALTPKICRRVCEFFSIKYHDPDPPPAPPLDEVDEREADYSKVDCLHALDKTIQMLMIRESCTRIEEEQFNR
jgi:GTPase SAR1 family protein